MFDFNQPNVPTVDADDVKKAIDSKESFVLIDVRTAGEYERGKIEGSIHIPVDEITCKIETSVPDKSTKVYVYCLSGSRSVHAVDTMRNMGYTNVFDVSHGLLAWRVKGFPVAS